MRPTKMRTVAFIISKKENEKRRAILPLHLKNIKHIKNVFIESGYGNVMGISDDEYKEYGATICSRNEALRKDVIIDPKVGDAQYLRNLNDGTILFGWLHLVQNKKLTDLCINKHFTTYCWEDMFSDTVHVFHKNNSIAGKAAVLHAFECLGRLPNKNMKVAILGNGNVASGAIELLKMFGIEARVYTRNEESLFKKEFYLYDVLINAILWDINRKDHIIYKNDISKMKKNSLIIDISCDHDGGFESSRPTTIKNPIYRYKNVYHYAVDHTPSIFFYDSSKSISEEVSKYVDSLIEGSSNSVLENSLGIKQGKIIDKKIIENQNR